jgi:aminoglycoside 3-N-acetyltransferase I
MNNSDEITVRRLGPDDSSVFHDWLAMFGEVFAEPQTYTGAPPGPDWIAERLSASDFFALAAFDGETVIGGLAAYVMKKFEQARSEVYIYDLAVVETHRRRGVATALIELTRAEARKAGAWMVSVQADYGDDPAIALYTKLGRREDVLHFDIDP